MKKRTIIAAIVFVSQATLAQSVQTTDRQVVNPEDSGYPGGWVQLDPAAAPRGALSSPIAAGHRFAGPEDSGYLGGWAEAEASPAQAAIPLRAASPAVAAERNIVNPEDSGYRGPGV